MTEETLFPTKHMQFRGRVDDPQAGPSMVETLEGLDWALEQLLAMESAVEKDKMVYYLRDVRRLKFGCEITRFIYLMCLCALKQADAETEQKLHTLADMLSKDTESMMGYTLNSEKYFGNALEATWLAEVYYKYFAKEKNDAITDIAPLR